MRSGIVVRGTADFRTLPRRDPAVGILTAIADV
jgi:hypothetical protein